MRAAWWKACGVKAALDALQRIGLGLGFLLRVSSLSGLARHIRTGGGRRGRCYSLAGFGRLGLAGSGLIGICPGLLNRLGLAVVGTQAQALGQFRQGLGGVAAALEADGQVEVVVGRIGVGGHSLAEERNAVLALAGQRNSLVVQNLGQRQNASHAGKGLFGAGVVAGEEQRKAAVEAGLKSVVGVGVAAPHLGKGRRRLLVLLAGIVLAAQRHPGLAELRAEHDSRVQVAQTLLLVGLGDAANVLLEGVQAQTGAGGHKGLLGAVEAGVELPGQLPGQRIEDCESARASRRGR